MQADREPDELVVEDAQLAIATPLRFLGRFTVRLSD